MIGSFLNVAEGFTLYIQSPLSTVHAHTLKEIPAQARQIEQSGTIQLTKFLLLSVSIVKAAYRPPSKWTLQKGRIEQLFQRKPIYSRALRASSATFF